MSTTSHPDRTLRRIDTPNGALTVRDIPGPPGAATVVLIHGWTATADANFGQCYAALARDVRVVAFDQRGHGSGLRSRRPFRLADCADDVANVAAALGIDRFVPVGYSMGGAVAQLVWRRHRARVRGLVLCATATQFGSGPTALARSVGLGGLAAVARLTPPTAQRWVSDRLYLDRKQGYWEPWAIEAAASHDWRTVLEAGAALGSFRSDGWIGDIDVPTAVIVPNDDHVVPPTSQLHMAATISTSTVFRTEGNHLVAAVAPEHFVPALRAAVAAVLRRSA